MRTFLFLAVVVGSLALVSAASARDVYVNNRSGDDTATGRRSQNTHERSGPVRTIAKALRLAETGDRIILTKTDIPYRECCSLVGTRNGGSSRSPFTIVGNGSTLDGSAPVPPKAWKRYQGDIFRFRPPRLAYQQLFIDDKPAAHVKGFDSASGGSKRLPELQPLEWCVYKGHIYFRTAKNKLPEDYALRYASRQVGITLWHVEHVVIEDLTIQGFQLDGVNASNSARHISLVGLTCRGNGRSGMVIGGASSVDIMACLVGNNGKAQLMTLPWSQTRIINSNLLSNTAPAWVDRGGKVVLDEKPVQGGLQEIKTKNLP